MSEPRKVKTETPILPPTDTISISYNQNLDEWANKAIITTIYFTDDRSIHPAISKKSVITYRLLN